MKAIELFNKWVDLGKDEGMKKNHANSVDYMISLIPNRILFNNYSFLDIGCGNGWVVKSFSTRKKCTLSVGIDGAKKMVEKAIKLDPKSMYLNLDLNNLNQYKDNFHVILSMEVLYYLKDPQNTVKYIYEELLHQGGFFVLGIDHYLENISSLSWPQDLNVNMKTYSIEIWKKMFIDAGFSNIYLHQFGQTKGWSGTLIISGEKIK